MSRNGAERRGSLGNFSKKSVRRRGDGSTHGRDGRRGTDPADSRVRFAGADRAAVGLHRLSGADRESTGADELIYKSNKEVPELLRAIRKLAVRPRRRGVCLGARPASSGSKAARHRIGTRRLAGSCAGRMLGGSAERWPHFSAACSRLRLPRSARTPAKTASLRRSDQAIAARWMTTMTLREKIAQLVVIGFSGHPMNTRTREYRKFVHLVAQEHVGGLILVNVSNGRDCCRRPIRWKPPASSTACSGWRRFRCWSRPISSAALRCAWMPPRSFRTPWRSRPRAIRTRRAWKARSRRSEARALGVQWLFFPGRRRQQQSRQPDHQHPLLRGEPGRCFGVRFGLHRRARTRFRGRAC